MSSKARMTTTKAFTKEPHIAILWLNEQSSELVWNNYSGRYSTVFEKIDEMDLTFMSLENL
ncbi:hypothetical protein [Bacillus kwashiorkori]|uniref:hypothetical protein n=1 Tax=Bacillus kwashiorkori TaxID=1522318 RepID=UPI000781CF2E|nr:hypothetical protein [Bacillus kwashiorkori]